MGKKTDEFMTNLGNLLRECKGIDLRLGVAVGLAETLHGQINDTMKEQAKVAIALGSEQEGDAGAGGVRDNRITGDAGWQQLEQEIVALTARWEQQVAAKATLKKEKTAALKKLKDENAKFGKFIVEKDASTWNPFKKKSIKTAIAFWNKIKAYTG